jgi:hypothetical protein
MRLDERRFSLLSYKFSNEPDNSNLIVENGIISAAESVGHSCCGMFFRPTC